MLVVRVRQIPRPVRADHLEPGIREINQAFEVARLPKQPADMPGLSWSGVLSTVMR
jgi:hypothetical protein